MALLTAHFAANVKQAALCIQCINVNLLCNTMKPCSREKLYSMAIIYHYSINENDNESNNEI